MASARNEPRDRAARAAFLSEKIAIVANTKEWLAESRVREKDRWQQR